MIKKTVHLIFVLLSSIACLQSTAQDIAVASGTAFKIAANETFHTNGLTLIPSAAFDLNGLSMHTPARYERSKFVQ